MVCGHASHIGGMNLGDLLHFPTVKGALFNIIPNLYSKKLVGIFIPLKCLGDLLHFPTVKLVCHTISSLK